MNKYFLSIVGFICVIGIFLYGITGIAQKSTEEGAANLQKAIKRACVQCYAIEGRYPSSVDYLVDNYGIQIDTDKYAVFYEGFASNLMPDITVCQL